MDKDSKKPYLMCNFAGICRKLKYFKELKKKTIIKYLISVALAAILMYFSFKGVNWEVFFSGLKNCRWGYIMLSMGAGIFAFWLRGLRWRGILLPLDKTITRKTAFNAVNIGYLANFVFPRIGEFVRCGIITKNSVPEDGPGGRKKASYDKVVGTVVLERSWDMLSMLLLMVILLTFQWDEFGKFFVDKMWIPIKESLDFSIWWIVLIIIASITILLSAIILTRKKFRLSQKLCNIISGIFQGFGTCLKMKDKWKFFLYTALIWLMYWLMSAATMWAMPDLDSLGVTDALFLMIAGSLGWLVPVPGGFGSFHFIVKIALATIYGIPPELGIVFATLSHESQAVTMAVCGGLSYGSEMFARKNNVTDDGINLLNRPDTDGEGNTL